MIPINPITGAALPAATAQQGLATDKVRQIRRQQTAKRNVAAAADTFQHTVENAEAVTEVKEDNRREQERRRQQHHAPQQDSSPSEDDQPPHLDVMG